MEALDDYDEDQSVLAKLVLLGESDVGKSSLVLRFVKDKFFERRENTIGAAFLTKTVPVGEEIIKFEIWDTAGQERYHGLAPMYYRDAQVAIIAYDITNQVSFSKAKKWLIELRNSGKPDLVIAVVGNKTDLASERTVSYEQGHSFSEQNGLVFFETSAKTAKNVLELFYTLAKLVPRTSDSVPPDTLILGESQVTEAAGCRC